MTLRELKSIGRELSVFLAMFASCFSSLGGRRLLRVYVEGQLSDAKQKNCEAIALKFHWAPRTLQRFLESIKWNEEQVRDRCQEIVARDHAHQEAIGTIDESGIGKSGRQTAAVGRQYNGNRGKIENCVVGVHVGYSAGTFRTILDSQMYLPEEWAEDMERRRQHYIPDEIEFQTKPQIALTLIDRVLDNGVEVSAWTFDELYGRDCKFLDALDQRDQAFVAEIPCDTRVWTGKPTMIRKRPKKSGSGRPKKTPRVGRRRSPCEVRNLIRYSALFRGQSWQKYRIKDTESGPEVWEVKWLRVWRQMQGKLPSKQQTLIVARNVRTGELKYFLSNRVVGRQGVTLRWLLRVAFNRWSIEACFRVAKEELGMDHFQVRGWRCIHRHYYLTALSYLFCSRIRQRLDGDNSRGLTVEQVRQAVNTYLTHRHLPLALRDDAFEEALNHPCYHQQRNARAKESHTKTRIEYFRELGIDVDRIKSCAA